MMTSLVATMVMRSLSASLVADQQPGSIPVTPIFGNGVSVGRVVDIFPAEQGRFFALYSDRSIREWQVGQGVLKLLSESWYPREITGDRNTPRDRARFGNLTQSSAVIGLNSEKAELWVGAQKEGGWAWNRAALGLGHQRYTGCPIPGTESVLICSGDSTEDLPMKVLITGPDGSSKPLESAGEFKNLSAVATPDGRSACIAQFVPGPARIKLFFLDIETDAKGIPSGLRISKRPPVLIPDRSVVTAITWNDNGKVYVGTRSPSLEGEIWEIAANGKASCIASMKDTEISTLSPGSKSTEIGYSTFGSKSGLFTIDTASRQVRTVASGTVTAADWQGETILVGLATGDVQVLNSQGHVQASVRKVIADIGAVRWISDTKLQLLQQPSTPTPFDFLNSQGTSQVLDLDTLKIESGEAVKLSESDIIQFHIAKKDETRTVVELLPTVTAKCNPFMEYAVKVSGDTACVQGTLGGAELVAPGINGNLICSLAGASTRTKLAATSPDGSQVAILAYDNVVRIYRIEDWHPGKDVEISPALNVVLGSTGGFATWSEDNNRYYGSPEFAEVIGVFQQTSTSTRFVSAATTGADLKDGTWVPATIRGEPVKGNGFTPIEPLTGISVGTQSPALRTSSSLKEGKFTFETNQTSIELNVEFVGSEFRGKSAEALDGYLTLGPPSKDAVAVRISGPTASFRRPLSAGLNRFTLSESSGNKRPIQIEVVCTAPDAEPSLHVFLAGVSDYAELQDLKFVESDISGLQEFYSSNRARCGLSEDPRVAGSPMNLNRVTLLGALRKFSDALKGQMNTTGPDLLVYLSGHGLPVKRDPSPEEMSRGLTGPQTDGLFVTHEVKQSVANSGWTPASGGVLFSEILDIVDEIRPRRNAAIILDTCYSGIIENLTVFKPNAMVEAGQSASVRAADRGIALFTSSRANEQSFPADGGRQSLFTKLLLEELQEAISAPDEKSQVKRLYQLYAPIRDGIREEKKEQTPYLYPGPSTSTCDELLLVRRAK